MTGNEKIDGNRYRGTGALYDIVAERRRQVETEVLPPERDDIALWPWHPTWQESLNRRHELIKSAALILAEIEHLDRAVYKSMVGGVQ